MRRIVVLLLWGFAARAGAQDTQPATRAQELQRAVNKKREQLKPEQESRGEQIFEQIHDKVLDSFLASPSGLGMKFGGLVTGSGFGLGPRYLLPDLAGERVRLEASLVASIKRYWTAELRLSFPRIAGRRFTAEFVARHSDAPSILYFGPGSDSRRKDVSNYRREDTLAGIKFGWRPDRRYWLVGYYAEALQVNVGPGKAHNTPSTHLLFSPQVTPGIDLQSHYLRGSPYIQFDFRDRPADPHKGGAYSVAYFQNWDYLWHRYSFNRLQAQAEQYFPFLNEKRVIALRVRTELSYTRGGDRIPFYMQPALGGPDDLRGFRQFRFHDDNNAVANAEYRWEVSPLLDMAAFVDAGNVFPRPGLIGFRNVRTAGGLGFRVKTRDAVVARLDVGASTEAFNMVQVLQRLCFIAILIASGAASRALGQKFYPDDPVQKIPNLASVEDPHERDINSLYDFFFQSFRPLERKPEPALGVNTLGEVPDSSWYTNRHALRRMSAQELRSWGTNHAPVAPFEVTGGKTEGITPGFQLRDAQGRAYFVKPDPITNPEMATAADVIGAHFFYALGYNTPENYILRVRLEDLSIGKDAKVRSISGKKRPMTKGDLASILARAPRSKTGQIQLVASLRLSGKPLGPFRYEGTRADDPNDVVPHDRRRELRGLRIFCAWLNHTDAKSGNSLDTLVKEGEMSVIRHHLIDFGSILGSDSDMPKNARYGHEYIIPTGRDTFKHMFAFGLLTKPWERIEYPEIDAVGRFEASTFDPETWTPNYPNPAFLSRLPDDEFWAAKIVMTFRDSDIRALLETGEYTDPRVVPYLLSTLRQRRDKIGRVYFQKVLSLDKFHVEGNTLRFDDLLVKYGFAPERKFDVQWTAFDNRSERHTPLDGDTGFHLPRAWDDAPDGTYYAAAISVPGDNAKTVTVYLRKHDSRAHVVGIDRTW